MLYCNNIFTNDMINMGYMHIVPLYKCPEFFELFMEHPLGFYIVPIIFHTIQVEKMAKILKLFLMMIF